MLTIDHVMFPIYDNNNFIATVNKYWKKFNSKVKNQHDRIFLNTKNFYVEYISVSKKLSPLDCFWSNAICIELDDHYWNMVKNPLIKTDYFITPYAGCGYFFVNSKYKYINRNINKNKNNNNGFIFISKKLWDELEYLFDIEWRLPNYIIIDKNLLHNYDMFVLDENYKLMAPYLQSNFSPVNDIYEKNNNIYIQINSGKNNNLCNNKIDYLKYSLIGIGEFSHGFQEIWDYRFQLLKKCMKYKKNICIYCEISIWQADNIMNDTEIQFEELVNNNGIILSKLSRYVHRAFEIDF